MLVNIPVYKIKWIWTIGRLCSGILTKAHHCHCRSEIALYVFLCWFTLFSLGRDFVGSAILYQEHCSTACCENWPLSPFQLCGPPGTGSSGVSGIAVSWALIISSRASRSLSFSFVSEMWFFHPSCFSVYFSLLIGIEKHWRVKSISNLPLSTFIDPIVYIS